MREKGLKAYATTPSSFQAPAVVIDFDDPFLTTDAGFDSVTVHLSLWVLINPSPKWEDEVIAMVGHTLGALRGTGIKFDSFQLYDSAQIDGTTRIFKGALIKIAAEVAIKELNE